MQIHVKLTKHGHTKHHELTIFCADTLSCSCPVELNRLGGHFLLGEAADAFPAVVVGDALPLACTAVDRMGNLACAPGQQFTVQVRCGTRVNFVPLRLQDVPLHGFTQSNPVSVASNAGQETEPNVQPAASWLVGYDAAVQRRVVTAAFQATARWRWRCGHRDTYPLLGELPVHAPGDHFLMAEFNVSGIEDCARSTV